MYESKQLTVKEAYDLGIGYILNIEACTGEYRGKGIYVLDFGNGVKIGTAKNLVNEIKIYKTPWCRQIVNDAYFKCQNEKALGLFLNKVFKKDINTDGSSGLITSASFTEVMEFIKNNKYFHYK